MPWDQHSATLVACHKGSREATQEFSTDGGVGIHCDLTGMMLSRGNMGELTRSGLISGLLGLFHLL